MLNVPALQRKKEDKQGGGMAEVKGYGEGRGELLGRPVSVTFATTCTPLSPSSTTPVSHHPLPPFLLKPAVLQMAKVQTATS